MNLHPDDVCPGPTFLEFIRADDFFEGVEAHRLMSSSVGGFLSSRLIEIANVKVPCNWADWAPGRCGQAAAVMLPWQPRFLFQAPNHAELCLGLPNQALSLTALTKRGTPLHRARTFPSSPDPPLVVLT